MKSDLCAQPPGSALSSAYGFVPLAFFIGKIWLFHLIQHNSHSPDHKNNLESLLEISKGSQVPSPEGARENITQQVLQRSLVIRPVWQTLTYLKGLFTKSKNKNNL